MDIGRVYSQPLSTKPVNDGGEGRRMLLLMETLAGTEIPQAASH